MKTVRFVLLCHSVGTSLPEIVLSAWMLASSFAGSPRCAFTLTRNVAAPAVVFIYLECHGVIYVGLNTSTVD